MESAWIQVLVLLRSSETSGACAVVGGHSRPAVSTWPELV